MSYVSNISLLDGSLDVIPESDFNIILDKVRAQAFNSVVEAGNVVDIERYIRVHYSERKDTIIVVSKELMEKLDEEMLLCLYKLKGYLYFRGNPVEIALVKKYYSLISMIASTKAGEVRLVHYLTELASDKIFDMYISLFKKSILKSSIQPASDRTFNRLNSIGYDFSSQSCCGFVIHYGVTDVLEKLLTWSKGNKKALIPARMPEVIPKQTTVRFISQFRPEINDNHFLDVKCE